MAIEPVCDRCGEKLESFGGLVFSPPSEKNEVRKFHVCVDCYGRVEEVLKEKA